MPKSTTYQKGHIHFTYHVAALIQDGDNHTPRVLLHRSAAEDYWSLPGGKVALGEEAEQALRRELRDTLGCEIEITRLLWLVENFYEHDGEKFHELGLFFLAHLPQGDPRLADPGPFEGLEQPAGAASLPLIFQWFTCQPEQLAALKIRPAFLYEGLVQIPAQMETVKIACGNL